jgi:DNA helicase II / ATP-dependent DNA helicase PcrA
MLFHADLHVHSKYSRATSRDLDLEHLYYWAARKGIALVGTGDCVHPAWLAELKDKLVPDAPGLYRLKDDIAEAIAQKLPASCRRPVRFMLSVEISTIYKKGDRTRKIHHLIYAPDFETVDRLAARLARIGNIASDGRPILGLDSRDLLEITLEAGPGAYLVPAHIWTPWFAALGSQSGFDSIVECYGDLAGHIHAVETGLSSDPAMNWRVSFLDRYRLTSNSDAHSPGKLGREATLFDCDVDYFAIRRALEGGEGYVGTVEFFPEEGKYHLDGHRKCGVRLTPQETLAHGVRCPVCGEPVTIGVAHRVETLADRDEAQALPPPNAGAVSSLVPLPEILSELAASGPASKAVERSYNRLLAALGPELTILNSVPVEDIARKESALLAEAVARLRAGAVIREAGYDGEYGVIRLFQDDELERRTGGGFLFDVPIFARKPVDQPLPLLAAEQAPTLVPSAEVVPEPEPEAEMPKGILAGLDPDQRAAAEITEGPLLILAGPGSGKTRTLTHRLAHLVVERGVPAASCLAITFTRRAAAEMQERLGALIPAGAAQVAIHTFHSLGLAILREHGAGVGLQRGFRIAAAAERVDALATTLDVSTTRAERLLRAISKAKRTGAAASGDVADAWAAYTQTLTARNWIDFDDLVGRSVDLLTVEPTLASIYQDRFRYICVDEFQDVDEPQYRLLRLLASPAGNLCAIGDPDQAIYGFRGADASCFDRFHAAYPDANAVHLERNYRSTGTIVRASAQVIGKPRPDEGFSETVREMSSRITIHTAPSEGAEAEFVVATIERLIGGHSFFSIDSGRAAGARDSGLSFADFAVLYRTEAQSTALCEALSRSGMPFKKGSHELIADQPVVRALLRELDRDLPDAALTGALDAAAERLQRSEEACDPAALSQGLAQLKTLAATCDQDRPRFFAAAALATEADLLDPRADRVSLLTMHAAKGLEFPVVFVVGLENGLVPLYWGELDPAAAAEERRLFYVAMTRAENHLFLSRAVTRQWRGRARKLDPSPFLPAIEAALVQHQQVDLPRRRAEDRQLGLF